MLKYRIVYAAGEGSPRDEVVECDYVIPPTDTNGATIQFWQKTDEPSHRLLKAVNPSCIIKMELLEGEAPANAFDSSGGYVRHPDPLSSEAFGHEGGTGG